MLNDPAEAQDVAQEAFVRLWKRGPSLEAPEDVLRWIYRASANLSLDALRRRKVREAAPAPVEVAPRHDELYEQRAMLQALAREVSEDEWKAALLTRVDGLGQAEAALVLGCTDRTLRRWLDRFDARVASFSQQQEVR